MSHAPIMGHAHVHRELIEEDLPKIREGRTPRGGMSLAALGARRQGPETSALTGCARIVERAAPVSYNMGASVSMESRPLNRRLHSQSRGPRPQKQCQD